MPEITLREIGDPNDPAIARFGRMQEQAYFAPETLISAASIPRLLERPDAEATRRNVLVVAEHGLDVVGGTLFHWLAEAGSGFSSFLGVARAWRGHGLARRLHERRFAVLREISADQVAGVFIDVVNPTRLAAADLAREAALDSDPWTRRHAFAHLGFGQVDIRYEQPVGGPNGGPVTVLDLLYCPRRPAATVPTDLVVATLRAYWTPWLGPAEAARHAAILRARADGSAELALRPPAPGAP
jgi:GNAT superfamily N-acetyltransferase